MNPEVFQISDGPEVRAYLAAEEAVIDRLLILADAAKRCEPERGMYWTVEATRRAAQLLIIRDWFDLR